MLYLTAALAFALGLAVGWLLSFGRTLTTTAPNQDTDPADRAPLHLVADLPASAASGPPLRRCSIIPGADQADL